MINLMAQPWLPISLGHFRSQKTCSSTSGAVKANFDSDKSPVQGKIYRGKNLYVLTKRDKPVKEKN
jgi:hypothetical protein